MDYKLTCFPCLRRKNKLKSIASSCTEIDEKFEYVIDKYSILKVALNASPGSRESIFQDPEEDSLIKLGNLGNTPSKEKKSSELPRSGALPPGETYSTPRSTAVLPVTTHSSRSVKEKPRPADILDSTSPISRRPVLKPNYVVIPSKASLHVKDIMITKREITNQYLNNFSSVFIDNLKDQVPKDPENLPRLGRPYTSALKNISIGNPASRSRKRGDTYRSKVQKLVYSLPDGTVVETGYEPDGVSNQAEDEYPVLVHSTNNQKKQPEKTPTAFKHSIKASSCSYNDGEGWKQGSGHRQAEPSISAKRITYEDIQALDVGYEFPNNEKYGVKPKMTKIRFSNLDADRTKEFPHRTSYAFDSYPVKNSKSAGRSQSFRNPEPYKFKSRLEKDSAEDQHKRLKQCLTESYYLTGNPTLKTAVDPFKFEKSICQTEIVDSWDAEYPKKKIEARKFSFTELEKIVKLETSSSADLNEKLSDNFRLVKMARPCFKGSARPNSVSSERSATYSGTPFQQKTFMYMSGVSGKDNPLCRSRSLESLNSLRREDQLQLTSKTVPFFRLAEKRTEELETETSNSLHSRDSKTSSLITSVPESGPEVDKKATLRWKIIIKHRKNESKKSEMASKK